MDPLQIIFGLVKGNFVYRPLNNFRLRCLQHRCQQHTEIRKRECCYLCDNSDKNPKMKMEGPSRLLLRVTLRCSSRQNCVLLKPNTELLFCQLRVWVILRRWRMILSRCHQTNYYHSLPHRHQLTRLYTSLMSNIWVAE